LSYRIRNGLFFSIPFTLSSLLLLFVEYVKLFSWADIAHGFNFIPRLSIELRNEVDDDEAVDCLVMSVDEVVSDDGDVPPLLFVEEYSLLFICLYLILLTPNSLEE